MTTNKCYLLFVLTIFPYSATTPSSEIVINNQSSCSLALGLLTNYESMLTLPDEIAPNEIKHGQIQFNSHLFSSNQQESIGQYISDCSGVKGVISFNFFIGNDRIGDLNYFLEITSINATSIITLPFGKTIVKNTLPVMVTLIDKEVVRDETHEEKHDITISTSESASTSSCRTNSNTECYQSLQVPIHTAQ